MLRGGSWNNNAMNARAAYRNNNQPDNVNNNIGFRLALVGRPDDSTGMASKLARAPDIGVTTGAAKPFEPAQAPLR